MQTIIDPPDLVKTLHGKTQATNDPFLNRPRFIHHFSFCPLGLVEATVTLPFIGVGGTAGFGIGATLGGVAGAYFCD